MIDSTLIKQNQETVIKLTNHLNEIKDFWVRAEEFMNAQKAFAPIQIEVPEGKLGFVKVVDQWRIVVERHTGWSPIMYCPSIDRVRFIPHYPALFAELVRSNEAFLQKIEQIRVKQCDPTQPQHNKYDRPNYYPQGS